MASYGVFLAACGFEYHGPKGHLGFAPRVLPPAPATAFFQSAFTTAEGWGSYSQRFETGSQKSEITLKWGKLRVRSLALGLPKDFRPTRVTLELAKSPLKADLTVKGERAEIFLTGDALLKEGERLFITLS
jgi:hypothetical protein